MSYYDPNNPYGHPNYQYNNANQWGYWPQQQPNQAAAVQYQDVNAYATYPNSNAHAQTAIATYPNNNPTGWDNRALGSAERSPTSVEWCTHCAAHPLQPSTYGDEKEGAPATLTHFHCHPQRICRDFHPTSIKQTVGCPVHRGVIDRQGHCYWCQEELRTGQLVPFKDLRDTKGYPGDDAMV